MLRSKGLTEKVLILGIDGMDPRFSKAMIDEGKMPNLKKLVEMGAAREDLMLLGAMPTITPPMWATLATGAYPMTHGVTDFSVRVEGDLDITQEAILSPFCKAEQLWNITAESGKKTLVWHWPGAAWPPTSDSPNLMVVDGVSPGGMGSNSMRADMESVIIATTKTATGGFKPYAAGGEHGSHINCDKSELVNYSSDWMDTKDPRIKEHYAKHIAQEGIVFQDYKPDMIVTIRKGLFNDCNNMFTLGDWALPVSISPISEPEGWANAPEGAKEFTIYYMWGHAKKPALILKNAEGKYDKVALYASKEQPEPVCVLENDVYTEHVPEFLGDAQGNVIIAERAMRLLEIAEDGTYVRMWASDAMNVNDDRVWYPRELFGKIKAVAGVPPATSMGACQDTDLILKCQQAQWEKAAQWQSKAMRYMIDEEGVEVIFSHFHGPDMSGHAYMKYLKDRDTSIAGEAEVRKWHENTYRWTDDYIGSFIPYVEEQGWTILIVSDHALVCPEAIPNNICDNSGVNAGVMKELGYTVMKKDENGNEINEIDWSKTRAVQTRSNSIYVNLKGRDTYGIVDPADKYELEEQIITDLYGYKDKRTGKRIVSVALHNKDAVLLGMGGEYAADIIILIHEDYNFDHGDSLSTACGHNDTSVSPIFVAAGPGVKQGHQIKGWVREVDVAPTAAVLLGVDIPAQCEGAPAYQIFTERM